MEPAGGRDEPNSRVLVTNAGALFRTFVQGLRALWRKDQASLELEQELWAYLEAATRDKMQSHPEMAYAEALRASRVEMGSMASVKQQVRSSGWESMIESLGRDLRYGARQLLRSPGFSIVAVLTVALGIGANTAVFTLLHAVMMKELPVANPQQLYRLGDGDKYCCEWGGLQDNWGTFDYAFYKHLRDTNTAFEQIAAFSGNTPSFNVRRTSPAEPAQTVNGEFVSGNYFITFGLQPGAGRLLAPADDSPQASAVAVLGYRAWQQRYNGDPSIIGSTLLINNLPVTLIGVAPRGYEGARLTSSPPELWVPLSLKPAFERQGQNSILYSRGMAWLYLIGRLKPGISPTRVQSQLSIDLQSWLRAEGRRDDSQHKIANQRIVLTPGGTGVSSLRSNSKQGLYLLSAAAALVLLIACANLANLLLARSASRRQQIALRISLGATRRRLIRAALTESVLLAVIGGTVGLLLAYAGTKGLLLLAFRGAAYIPISASPSLPVLGFATLLSILTGILFGIAPAWIGTHAELSNSLRDSSRNVTSHSSWQQGMFITIQAALSLVLLALAGLVTHSLTNLENSNLGFETRGRLLAEVNPKAAGYQPEQLPALYDLIQHRLEAIPGVRDASLSLSSPQDLCCVNLNISIAGRADKWIDDVNVVFDRVTPHYFETIGTPLLRGRALSARDNTMSRHVAVVDQAFARKFFPNTDPIGQHFGLSLPGHANDYEIVGVVSSAKYRSPASVQSPMAFLPFTQTTQYEPSGYRRLEIGTLYAQSIQLYVSGNPESYEKQFRAVVAGINPNLSLISLKTYTEQVAIQHNQERLIARLTTLFGLLALLLASVGLYGVTAYNVARRTNEIGLRIALGADRLSIAGMILRGAFRQVSIGLIIGIPLAVLCGHYLAHQLYGVGAFDVPVLLGATVLLVVSALTAGFLPAYRAVSIEPLDAIRVD